MGLVTPPGLVFRKLLHQSPRTTVFSARAADTGAELIVKSPANPIPQAEEIASYRRECDYCNLLQAESARCLEHAGQIYLLRPDCQGRPLDQLQPGSIDLHRLLNQALQQLEILERAGVVHQEIQPGHLIWSEGSGLRLVGWSAATGRATNPARAPDCSARGDMRQPREGPARRALLFGGVFYRIGSIPKTAASGGPRLTQPKSPFPSQPRGSRGAPKPGGPPRKA